MIVEDTVDGEQVMVAYLDASFKPADKDKAIYAKVLFDDGRMVILSIKAKANG